MSVSRPLFTFHVIVATRETLVSTQEMMTLTKYPLSLVKTSHVGWILKGFLQGISPKRPLLFIMVLK